MEAKGICFHLLNTNRSLGFSRLTIVQELFGQIVKYRSTRNMGLNSYILG